MNTPNQIDQIIAKFTSEADTYARMSGAVAHLLSQIISSDHLTVHSITHRCKEIASLSKKLARPEKNYQSLAEITDLAGIRVTTYFPKDVDRVARLIEQEFQIDKNNTIDKRIALDPDKFGYQSLHYIAQLKISRSALIEYKSYEGKKFEIQVRSILQHAWAEIEHDLGYKSATGIPKEIRRRFARIAGLLEIADDEFEALRLKLRNYEQEIKEKNISSLGSLEIDLPSLKAAYASNLAVTALDRAIAEKAGAQISVEPSDTLERAAGRLLFLGIKNISQLEQATRENHELATNFAAQWIDGKYDKLPMGVGIFYLAYALMAIKKDKSAFLSYLNQFNIGRHEERDNLAERAISIASRIEAS